MALQPSYRSSVLNTGTKTIIALNDHQPYTDHQKVDIKTNHRTPRSMQTYAEHKT